MENVLKKYPEVGDIVVLVGGEKRFIRGSEATTAYVDTLDCIGVVYDVQGKLVRIVGGENTTAKKWSAVADYEITAIPSASGSYEVTLNNVSQGSMTYTMSEGTIAEFTTQLETWLRTLDSSAKGYKWEAYTNGDHSYLQCYNYTEYESTVSISGCTLVKLIGSEVASYTSSTNRNQILQKATYNGMCRQRLYEYCVNSTAANCNPTTAMDGTTKLFATFPCSKTYYDGSLGGGLRSNFATYDDYLDACMTRYRDLDVGTMQFRDGKAMCDLLKTKTVLVQGTETAAYPAVDWAVKYDSGVTGYGAGTWWLPSMYELSILMKDITKGTSASLDAVNTALGKVTGWTQISSTSYRWSCCRYGTYGSWYYSGNGFSGNGGFYSSLAVSAVSAFTLE